MTVPCFVDIVGVPAAGWGDLPADQRSRIAAADIVLGGERHLAMLPDEVPGKRWSWPRPLRAGLTELVTAHADQQIVALASGDPLVSGIGTTLIELLGPGRVRVHPAISSVALARARMGWSAESSEVVSLTKDSPDVVRRFLAPGARLIVLCADETSPAAIADVLRQARAGAATLDLWSDLGSAAERHQRLAASDAPLPMPRLTIACVTCPPHLAAPALIPGLPDGAFVNDGQLTKRDVRASALARLAPHPGELLWDVGAGAGSISIEWMRAHPRNRAIAIEANTQRSEAISHNAAALGVPALGVVTGEAPAALADLPSPDAIFLGGGVSVHGVLERCLSALPAHGRMVAHAVTFEAEQTLAAARSHYGGSLTRIHIESLEPLGGFTGFRPGRAVTQWTYAPTLPLDLTAPGEPS